MHLARASPATQDGLTQKRRGRKERNEDVNASIVSLRPLRLIPVGLGRSDRRNGEGTSEDVPYLADGLDGVAGELVGGTWAAR